MSWGVDDVEAVIIPKAGGRSGLNRNTTFFFLIHEVGGSGSIMHFTQFVNLAGQLEDTFGGRGFSGIHVCENTDISVSGEVCHCLDLSSWVGDERRTGTDIARDLFEFGNL